MVKVKICGITNLEDAIMSVEAGADALGFVFYHKSPRNILPEQASEIIRHLPPFVQTVGLFVNDTETRINKTADCCGLDIVQLHGDEMPDFCTRLNRRVIKALRVRDITSLEEMVQFNVAAFLLDAWSPAAYGGTGQTFNWDIAEIAAKSSRIILAGGLTVENVAEAIRKTRPYAVDVSSSLELSPGKKDPAKICAFIRNAKESML
jgi:phosphoribosylanthranilate isomerase